MAASATIARKGALPTETDAAQARPRIEWAPPPPRSGLLGAWDRFVGPGATPAEIWLQLALPLAAAIAAAVAPLAAGYAWPWWKLALASFLALDTVGGVITNSTQTAKRWYHREGQTVGDHMSFVAAHLLQLTLVGWLFRGNDWGFIALLYTLLLLGSAVIVGSPRYLQRPVASGLYLVALVVTLQPSFTTPGLEWFGPVFFLKLFVAHLPFEAPLATTNSKQEDANHG